MAEKKAVVLQLKLWAVYLIGGLYCLCVRELSFCDGCLIVCGLLMFSHYVLYRSMDRENQKLLSQLGYFLGELRYQYSYCKRVEEALEECIYRQEGMMGLHGRQLLFVMRHEDMQEEYLQSVPNRFLSLLFVLCQNIYDYGDTVSKGQSVFLEGLGVIKNGVETELLKQKKTEHLFSGLLVTCMIPIAFVKVIELWAISNMEELKVYYQGRYGMLTSLLLCILTLFCYYMVRRMRYEFVSIAPERKWLWRLADLSWVGRAVSWQINRNYQKSIEKHRNLKACGVQENLEQFIVLQYVTAFVAILFTICLLCSYRGVCKRQLVYQSQALLQELYQMREEEKESVEKLVEGAVAGKDSSDMDNLDMIHCSKEVKKTLKKEIRSARACYQDWHYPFYMYLLPILCGSLAYIGRYRLLLLKKQAVGMKREEEILVFQAVILFLMHVEQMTGEEIMQWLEKLAYYFKDSIVNALYRLVYQDYEEAGVIKDAEDYMPLVMILEGIMACDQLPVEEAFLQMEADYQSMSEAYREECMNLIQDRSAVCKVLAFVPLYMTVGLKLIVPFVLEGLSKLEIFSESMKQFM